MCGYLSLSEEPTNFNTLQLFKQHAFNVSVIILFIFILQRDDIGHNQCLIGNFPAVDSPIYDKLTSPYGLQFLMMQNSHIPPFHSH